MTVILGPSRAVAWTVKERHGVALGASLVTASLLLGALGAAVSAHENVSVTGKTPLEAEPLGVQACITGCQSRFTDCNIACDSRRSCHKICDQRVVSCIDRCRELDRELPPSDAGVDGDSSGREKPSEKPAEKAAPKPKKAGEKPKPNKAAPK